MELARRGIVALAIDMYGHGDSSNVTFNFVDSYNGLELLAALPYVDADRCLLYTSRCVYETGHKVVLSTKCGIQLYDKGGELHFTREGHEGRLDLSPKAIRRDLELSLKALGTDYIDVYYTHWQCMTYGLVPVAETMGELMRMKEEGKIRAIGASNVNLQILRDYEAAGQLDVIQEKLSILDRKPEAELLPFCQEHGLTLQAYSPIEQGLLGGKAGDDYVPSKGNVREGKTWWKDVYKRQCLKCWKPFWGHLPQGWR